MNDLLFPDGRSFTWRDSGNGPPLILIHGWGNTSAVFTDLMAQLPDYQCLAPDLPGYGTSHAAKNVELSALADDFVRWLDALKIERVALLGWSLGGMLALELAIRFPERIQRLILIASTPRFVSTDDWQYGLADAAVRALARDIKRAPTSTLENFWRLQFQGEEFIPSPLLPTVEMMTALGGLEILRQVDLREELVRITMPTLVVHGTADTIIPIAAGYFLANSLPYTELLEISGCGHAPFLSAPRLVSTAIRKFLP